MSHQAINSSVALIHFNDRPNGIKIDTIILHSMYCPFPPEDKGALDPEVCIQWLDYCQVSSHYIISQDGSVYQLVNPNARAWHAGKSKMPDGREGVNDFSIGIELISPQIGSYPIAQIESLKNLITYLKQQFPIKFILGHKDVAFQRNSPNIANSNSSSPLEYLERSKDEPKTDPWNFPWDKLNL